MRSAPFRVVPVSRELGAGHEKNAPANQPATSLAGAVATFEHPQRGARIRIKVPQPGVGSALVVGPAPAPTLDDARVVRGADSRDRLAQLDPAVSAGGAQRLGQPLIGRSLERRFADAYGLAELSGGNR